MAELRAVPSRAVRERGREASRVLVLAQIADWYSELVDPLSGPSGVPGDGESPVGMPRTYTPTVREFERLLGVMRNRARQEAYAGFALGKLRWHVMEWFVSPPRVRREEPVFVDGKGGKRRRLVGVDGRPVTRPRIVRLRHRDAREDRALLGLEWMAANWGLVSEPMLPREMVEAA